MRQPETRLDGGGAWERLEEARLAECRWESRSEVPIPLVPRVSLCVVSFSVETNNIGWVNRFGVHVHHQSSR